MVVLIGFSLAGHMEVSAHSRFPVAKRRMARCEQGRWGRSGSALFFWWDRNTSSEMYGRWTKRDTGPRREILALQDRTGLASNMCYNVTGSNLHDLPIFVYQMDHFSISEVDPDQLLISPPFAERRRVANRRGQVVSRLRRGTPTSLSI